MPSAARCAGGGPGGRLLLPGLGVLALFVPLLLILRGWPRGDEAEPASHRSLTAEGLRALAPDAEGDARLLAHLRLRVAPGSAGHGLPRASGVLYATLRMEELGRTDGWPLGLAATVAADGEVAPEGAAEAYDALGLPGAAQVMRRLQPLIAAERSRWQAYREARDGTAPPAGRGFAELAQSLDGMLPAIRAARRTWTAAHADELASP